jgi:hypothetical protein
MKAVIAFLVALFISVGAQAQLAASFVCKDPAPYFNAEQVYKSEGSQGAMTYMNMSIATGQCLVLPVPVPIEVIHEVGTIAIDGDQIVVVHVRNAAGGEGYALVSEKDLPGNL